MYRDKSWGRMTFALPLALLVACGGGPESGGAPADRELELALGGDTVPATFEDTAITVVAPRTDRPEPQPVRRPQPQREAPPPAVSPPVVEPVRAPRSVTATVPVGATMSLTLDETLSTETNVAGDAFTATLSAPVLDVDGAVLIPAGAKVRGRVTQVQKSGRIGETAILNLAFEAVSFDERTYPLEASVVSANPERVSRTTTAENVGKVATGAVAGAILGHVLGKDKKSAVKGAVVGAAAGTAIAMGTADVDAVLKQGSAMVIKLDAPITMTRTVTS